MRFFLKILKMTSCNWSKGPSSKRCGKGRGWVLVRPTPPRDATVAWWQVLGAQGSITTRGYRRRDTLWIKCQRPCEIKGKGVPRGKRLLPLRVQLQRKRGFYYGCTREAAQVMKAITALTTSRHLAQQVEASVSHKRCPSLWTTSGDKGPKG